MIIFTTGSMSRTPRLLCEHLPDARVIRGYRGRRIRSTPDDLVVNWGYHGEVNTPAKVLNRRAGVDKVNQIARFMNNDIPHPSATVSDTGWVWKPINGYGGRGVHFAEVVHGATLRDNEFAQAYIPKVAEFRVHVLGGGPVAWTRKKANEDVNPDDHVAWNHDNGFVQQEIKNRIQKQTTGNVAVAACNALGYDFGAVDIIMDKLGSLYVLEVNSAPSLTVDNRIDAYVGYFNRESPHQSG